MKPRKATAKDADRFMRQAFVDRIAAQAALLVIHRVARAMEANKPQDTQKALDQLLTFAGAHPLSPDMEKHL